MDDIMTFAVGDIHGCFDKLAGLVAACDSISAGKRSRFVFLGDYVDRGPDTRKVIEFLIRGQQSGRFVCLRGNHEELLVGAAARDRTDRGLLTWWANGGEQTLDSYGVKDPSELPEKHLAWIEGLPLTFEDGGRLFVHAGVRPGVPLPHQDSKDLIWIREPFLSFEGSHGVFVVHGHTPTRSRLPDLRTNRLNIDTGACLGGPLTAALFSVGEVQPLMFLNEAGATW